jgi:biopolymer transport protein ExbD
MSRSHHYRRPPKEPPELNITSFLNLMVALVPFLLITAVFSRITILELNMPAAGGAGADNKPKLTVEVIVREQGLELGNGKTIIARFPKVDNENPQEGEEEKLYDLKSLTKYLMKIKQKYPTETSALVLMEPDLKYDYLVQVMDVVRMAEFRREGAAPNEPTDKIELFPEISIGDAP